jgi:hypothetical protein
LRARHTFSGVLSELLTPAIAEFLQRAPEPQRYKTPDELDAVIDRWAASGAALVTVVGASRSGRPIRVASFGSGTRSMLAWGYPHPDEPLGAEALVWLGDGLAQGRLCDLAQWTVHLLLCADPDETVRNAGWLHGPRTAEAFTAACWRPTHLGVEVDYGFGLDWGPFVYPPPDAPTRCRTREECERRCGNDGCRNRRFPFAPLPESEAIARAIDLFAPDVAATMHCVHAGADYTFLLEPESRAIQDALLAIPSLCGSGRWLGEPIDAGRRWRMDAPDLIVERDLTHRLRLLERSPGYDPRLLYYATASAACYLQAQGRGAQLITPEAAQFRCQEFSDPTPVEELEEVLVSVEDRPRAGRSRVVRINVDGEWVVAHQDRAPGALSHPPRRELVPLTRGMVGVRELVRRRRVLAQADRLWERARKVPGLRPHPYADERWQMEVPGAYVSDRSMWIYRTRSDYRRPPTVAQKAALEWRGPIHTASLLGNFSNWLAAQPDHPELDRVRERLDALRRAELARVPPRLLAEAPRGPALRSMLARVLLLMARR